MKKIFYIIAIMLLSSSLFAKPYKYPLTENLMGSTQWDLVMREFEITLKIGKCGSGLNYAIGFEAHMIDTAGYFETVNHPLNFPFIGVNLNGNPVKKNTPFETNPDGGDTPKTQVTNAHFTSVPIFGMIFKKNFGFWCLNSGMIDLGYISEFDPTYKNDFMAVKMLVQMTSMFSPDTLVDTIFDCTATEVAASIYGNFGSDVADFQSFEAYGDQERVENDSFENDSQKSVYQKYRDKSLLAMNTIRNSLYFIDGCNGFNPIGGYEDGNDPILDSHNQFHGISNYLFGAGSFVQTEIFKKQTNASFSLTKGNQKQPANIDTMCEPKAFPMHIPSQFVLQQVYPTVGSAKEGGQDGATTSTMRNLPGAEGQVFLIWERRDYYAFAYNCPGTKSKH